jgi:hypothetical protein
LDPPGSWWEMQNLSPTPDLPDLLLYFNKIHR